MQVARGVGAAHRHEGVGVDTRSLSFQRRRTKRPHRRPATGSRTPEPCRPLGRQGGPANGSYRVVLSKNSHLRKRQEAVKWSRERGCAGCAQKHAARVGGIAGDMRSPGLTPASALPTVELTRPSDCS